MNDANIRQLDTKLLTQAAIPLNNLDRNPRPTKQTAQILGDLTAADHNNILYGIRLIINLLKEFCGVFGGGNDGDNILLGKHKVAVGDKGLVAALDRAHQHVAPQLGDDVLD